MRRREFIKTAAAAGSAVSVGTWEWAAAEVSTALPKRSIKANIDLFTQPDLKPVGSYYQAEAPDTLDLAERARLAVNGLINFGDPERLFDHYQIGRFNSQPAYMSHYGAVGCEMGGITEGLLMTRHMSGSTEKLPEEETMFKGIVGLMNEKGEFAVETNESWLAGIGRTSDTLIPKNTGRMIMAFMVQNQIHPSPRMTSLISTMANSICEDAKVEGEYAALPAVPPLYKPEVLGPWLIILNNGTALRALSRTYALTGDAKYLDMATKLKNTIMRPEYWVPEVAPKAVMAGEHGQFEGHLHAFTGALMGLLWYSSLTNDVQLKQFVRESYQFVRTFGIARMGQFGEQCVTGDMTWLAIKMSDLGLGDYWEDVDQYVRNQLVEGQVTDAAAMHRCNATMPPLVEMANPEYAKRGYTTDNVIDRFVGAWRSDASNPANTYPQNFMFVSCCSNNNPPAMHAAWEATVRYNAGVARVNLLLNRASPWLDMDSYLPYQGKVVIRNKAAKQLFVRIPLWVDRNKVTALVNQKRRPIVWVDRCLFIDGLQARDTVQIEFPMVETKETYTLKWKPEDRWLEVGNPGYTWKPHDPPEHYTLVLKGNTVVDVSPRTRYTGPADQAGQVDIMNTTGLVKAPAKGDCFPLYMRTYYQRDEAPTKQVTRFLASVSTVKW